MSVRILHGDCRSVLRDLPDESVHCVVTSPPYFNLRAYLPEGHADKHKEIGSESTPDAYVAELVAVFREVRRILRSDGVAWINLGDGFGPGKQLRGIPWKVAFALQADGWILRCDVIWEKPNPMPESVTDRPTKSHEYLFLLSKSERYYYDADAIKEPPSEALLKQVADGYSGSDTKNYAHGGAQSASGTKSRIIENARKKVDKQRGHGRRHAGFNDRWDALSRDERMALGSNKRSVWTVATQPFSQAHFATFPPDLIEPCIKAGTSEKGCCAKCGAPWKREVEKSGGVDKSRDLTPKHALADELGVWHKGQEKSGLRRPGWRGDPPPVSTTLGWSPSCSCDAAVVPCTVMDPFGGAGTTGLVADRLQRSAVLIELNHEYATMSERRLGADAGMFAEIVAA